MELVDFLGLVHPAIAVTIVFPCIGIVSYFAWQTRERRLQSADGGKSKIPPIVGGEHKRIGEWLCIAVVGLCLLGLAYPIGKNIIKKQLWNQNLFSVIFILLMFVLAIICLVLLLRARERLWRGVFATLTGTSLVILGCQDGVFRRTSEWYWSHYYIGITASLLMIFSVAIVQDIYQDRSHRWRLIHTILNCVALLLFLGQGFTGSRDLLEIPLNWQESYIYQCNYVQKTCLTPNNQAPK
ncbi:DUF4079 domain-containing protein [Aliinostoc sp. HNIBRCY26]|uniref:DUF4079 domain-containing protein n=1 Tax=Aliinostoc sp. HNIBRCY26 TaxID=3418997 RepID=UPI003D021EF5